MGRSNRTVEDRVPPARRSPSETRRPVIRDDAKAKGDPYFVSCRAGAGKRSRELGVELNSGTGPTSRPAKQNEVVENWIYAPVDVIDGRGGESRRHLDPCCAKARERSIRVLTWDADAEADARDFFVNQATDEGIANALTDESGAFAWAAPVILRSSPAPSAPRTRTSGSRPSENASRRNILILKLATIRPSDDDRDKAFAETQTILKVYPSVKLMMAISAPAVPGSAEPCVKPDGRMCA